MRYFKNIYFIGLGIYMIFIMNAYADTLDMNFNNANLFADPNSTFAQQGVQLFVMGEYQLIIIPTDRTFLNDSMLLRRTAYPFLDDLVKYLQNVKKVSLRISVYSSRNGDDNQDGLSEQRARSLANYLWLKDIDTRLISITGYDDSLAFPFISGLSPQQFENGRIEISFRELREYV